MSRSKKTRSLKSVVSVKTGSKSKILENDGNKGKNPFKNKLSKHKKKPKSAYAKFLSEKGNKDSKKDNKPAEHPYKAARRKEAQLEQEKLKAEQQAKQAAMQQEKEAKNKKAKIKQSNDAISRSNDITPASKGFDDLDGDELLDFFEKFLIFEH